MRRKEFHIIARQEVHQELRMSGRMFRPRNTVNDITKAVVEAWPGDPDLDQQSVREQLKAKGYSSIWLTIISSLISIIIQILISKFSDNEGGLILLED